MTYRMEDCGDCGDLDFPDNDKQEVTIVPASASMPNSSGPRIIPKDVPTKWADLGGGYYKSSGKTQDRLPAGCYRAGANAQGELVFMETKPITDELIELPDSASKRVMKSIETFWKSKDRFAAKKQIFKRGILLWGPPGSGKTAVIAQLTKDLIENDGIVLYTSIPDMAELALTQLRKIESERHLICVLEDIDEMVARFGEHSLLSLLDGDTQIKNVVFLATTNYPDRLAKRIINRPSRFDEIIKVGMPGKEARYAYLRSRFTYDEMSDEQLAGWVVDTEGLSMAHLRELTVGVYCLGRDYNETLQRLHDMERNLSIDTRKMGF